MAFKDVFKEFPVIRTERLVLNQLGPDDGAAMCRQLRVFPDTSNWPGSIEAQSPEKAAWRIQHRHTAFKRKENIHWAIRKARGKGLIGVCSIFDFAHQTKAEIAYWIGKRYWNNGFATEAVTAIVAFGFDTLELHRIYAHCHVDNMGSQRVLQKAKLQKEGVLRLDCMRGGKWTDSAIYAIVKDR